MPTHRTSKPSKKVSADTTTTSALDDLQLIDSDAASRTLNISRDTLTVWRSRGVGPPFVRLERGGIRYLLRDLQQYIQRGRVVPKVPKVSDTVEVST